MLININNINLRHKIFCAQKFKRPKNIRFISNFKTCPKKYTFNHKLHMLHNQISLKINTYISKCMEALNNIIYVKKKIRVHKGKLASGGRQCKK